MPGPPASPQCASLIWVTLLSSAASSSVLSPCQYCPAVAPGQIPGEHSQPAHGFGLGAKRQGHRCHRRWNVRVAGERPEPLALRARRSSAGRLGCGGGFALPGGVYSLAFLWWRLSW